MYKQFRNSKKGFTLVEIIVVLVIVAILAAISLPALTGYIAQSRVNKAELAIADVKQAMVAAAASIDVSKLGEKFEIWATYAGVPNVKDYTIYAKKVQQYLSDYKKDGKSQFVIVVNSKRGGYADTDELVRSAYIFYFPKGITDGVSQTTYKGEYYQYNGGVLTAINQ